jgi:hypothetical protein
MYTMCKPVVDFSALVNVSAAPWIFPFLLSRSYMSTIVLVGAVVLFCDAPFMNDMTPYECIRSGKKSWVSGQLLYVFAASLVYVLFLILVSILVFFPYMDLQNDWGRVINTLSRTSAGSTLAFPISPIILTTYTPLEAIAASGSLLLLEVSFVGLVMFVVNLTTRRAGGVVIGLLFAFLPTFFESFANPWMYYFAPTTWANLALVDVSGLSVYPPISYAFTFLVLACALLSQVVRRVIRRQSIEVMQQV